MKKAILVVAQFCLFFVVFLTGSLLDPFHLKWFVTQVSPTATRYFVPDGLILMAMVYLLVVTIEAVRKQLAAAGMLTTLAFVLALVFGVLSKFGMITHDLLG